MPVEFLSDDQAAAYERFVGDLSRAELEGFFLLDGTALDLIANKRGDHNRLGVALQIGTVRYLGHFLTEDPLDVPWPAVEYLAAQLEVADPSVVKRYTERQKTAYEHSWEIRAAYGYRDFVDDGVREPLVEFMAARAWIHAEGAVALFGQAKAWLRRERVLLPGVSVLARLVATVREDADQRMYRVLAEAAAGADVELPLRLRDLLEVPEGKRFSELERLRKAPRRDSGLAMTQALGRVDEVLSIGAGATQVQTVPANRIAVLARYGMGAKAPHLARMPEPRRTATLLATARQLEAAAVDDALDLFDSLMATRLISPARRATDKARLAAMPRLEKVEDAGPDASVRVVPGEAGRMRLSVQRLEKLGDPPSLVDLRKRVAAMLPIVDLPELLMDVHSWTGMLDAYSHVGGLATSMDQLPVSVAALLVADACNVGLVPVIRPGDVALSRDRLSHVDQNYIRPDTHAAANARLVDYQARIGITDLWGGGLVASVDGLRFVVPVQTIQAGPSPRFFGYKRGITWLNAVNDRFAGLGAIIVTGTVRDSLYILDTLLNLDAGPKPEMVATDTASYSDIVFGLFRLLGYRFSPRIADLGGTGFWRADLPGRPAGDYGPLNAIARNKVNLDRIVTHWPDMLRVAGSLVTNQVRAYDLLRMLTRDGYPTPLGQALAEYGRISKTLHLLAMVDPVDETYRRTVTRQLNIGESRHSLARKIFHGHRGDVMQPYRAGQEDQLGALGLVLNAVVLFNTRYIDLAVNVLRGQGYPVRDEDAVRLSPLGYAHVNMLGRYTFPVPSAEQRMRPLRDPDAQEG